MADVVELTDSTFDSETEKGVALVDFWAPWCGPCKMQHPVLERVAKTLAGRAMIAKVNVDAEGSTAGRFGVQSIPTMILLKDGEEVQRFVGLTDEAKLVTAIEGAL